MDWSENKVPRKFTSISSSFSAFKLPLRGGHPAFSDVPICLRHYVDVIEEVLYCFGCGVTEVLHEALGKQAPEHHLPGGSSALSQADPIKGGTLAPQERSSRVSAPRHPMLYARSDICDFVWNLLCRPTQPPE